MLEACPVPCLACLTSDEDEPVVLVGGLRANAPAHDAPFVRDAADPAEAEVASARMLRCITYIGGWQHMDWY